MQIGFGHLQMSSAEFWNSTPREFLNRLFGYSEVEKRRFENDEMNIKMIMYWMILNNPYIDKHSKPKSFKDFNESLNKKDSNKTANTMSKAALFSLMGIKDE